MPKWILGTKRWRPKEAWEPVDLKQQEEAPLHEGARNAASSSSDSGCSMSPIGSSSSEQDPGERTLELDWKPSCNALTHVSSKSEYSGEGPLDLSLKDHRGGTSESSYARPSGDLGSSDGTLRRLKTGALRDAVSGAKGHASLIDPLAIGHQITLHLYDAKLHQHNQQKKQQQQQLVDHHPFQGSSGEPKPKGKTPITKKRHMSADGDDEGHVTEALVTPEAVAKLERIENKIGGYDCKLCTNRYSNAFDLANHNCSGIVKVEHRCPECNKVFQCPANLASHRRWHGLRASNREPSWLSPVASPSDAKDLST